MKYLKLFKQKLFWKALYVFIKHLFIGMDNHEDWWVIWNVSRDIALMVYLRPVIEEMIYNELVRGFEETGKQFLSMGEMIVDMFRTCEVLE